MGTIGGTANIEIEAPIEAVFAAAADVEASASWQPEIKVAECLERDRKGNQVLARMETDVKVRRIETELRFSFEPPTAIAWTQEKGAVKSVEGGWDFEDLGGGRTRATYRLEVDLGRVLGLAIRGPLVGVLRGQMVDGMPKRLKHFVEDGAG